MSGNFKGNQKQTPLERGLVKGVSSGDTITVVKLVPMDKMSARGPQEFELTLHGVKSPFMRGKENQEEPFAWNSREFLRKMLIGQGVLFRVTNSGTGNRRFAELYLPTGEDVKEAVVANGWAEVHTGNVERRDESKARTRLLELQQKAKDAKLGIWGDSTDAVRKLEKNTDSVALFNTKLKNTRTKAVIEKVRNGTSFTVYLPEERLSLRVFLSGAQSPYFEFKTPEDQQPAFAREAKFFSELEVLHKDVEIVFEATDQSGTYYGSVFYGDSYNLAEELLSNGLATYVDWTGILTSNSQKLKACEASAKNEGLRLWTTPTNIVPSLTKSSNNPNEFWGRVIEVHNAATITVIEFRDGQRGNVLGKERKIFFASIATPKNIFRDQFKSLSDTEKIAGFYAIEGKEALRKKIIGKKVKCIFNYVRPEITRGDNTIIPETPFYSVYLDKKNVALDLVANGYVGVVEHRASENRSSDFNELISRERNAIKKSVGLHSPKSQVPSYHLTNFTVPIKGDGEQKERNYEQIIQAQSARFKQHLPLLVRGGRMPAVIDRVFTGSRFHIWIEKETCVIPMTLHAVRCERSNELEPESPGQLAYVWAHRELFQRDVEIIVESVDEKSGNFTGIVFLNGRDIAPGYLEKGQAHLYDKPAKLCKNIAYDAYKRAEDSAKKARLGIWQDYDEEEERRRKQEIFEKREAERLEKRKSENIKVVITDVVDGQTFYYQVINEEDTEKKISDLIQGLGELSQDESFKPEKDQIVLAKFQGDWYRGKVVAIHGEKFKIFYVDYGNFDTVEVKDLRPITKELDISSIPQVANKGVLSHIKTPGQNADYFEDAAADFSELVMNKEFDAVVEHKDEHVAYIVLAISEKETVNEVLVERGLARVKPGFTQDKDLRKRLNDKERKAKNNHRGIWEYGDVSDDEDN